MIHLNCLGFTYYTIIILIIVGSILYYLYSIVYLIEDYNIANDCKSSHMWEYVLFNLLSTILNTILINKNSNYVNDNNNQGWNATLYTYLGLMNLCMTLWGGIELWDISCSELSRSNLWKASLVTFVINGVTTFVFVVSPPLLLCYLSNLFEGNTTIRSPTIDASNV